MPIHLPKARPSSIFVFFLLIFAFQAYALDTTFVSTGAMWKYHDHGAVPANGWRTLSFDDSSWPARPAHLAYDDLDDATSKEPSRKITTYYRNSFTVTDPAEFKTLTLQVLREHGAIVYLNNTEIYRSRKVTGNAPSSSDSLSLAKDQFIYAINPALLSAGQNVLAVEMQRTDSNPADTGFDLSLVASASVTLTRGPYLQIGTSNSITFRWRTSAASDARVSYGLDPAALNSFVDDATSTAEHIVKVSGLTANTRYYYAIGTTTGVIAGGTSDYTFLTSPIAGTVKPTRVWVLGDSGTANSNAAAVRDAYTTFTGSTNTDFWLMLGDNAYNSGLDSEFQTAVFNMYPAMLRKSVLWPTLGNHDGISADSATQSGPYYDDFSLPKNAEAGGLASGTEAYYSFDYANMHFICLESFETDRSVNGPMMTWLKNDLAANTREWTIAFWHHPPYSKGSHDSDTDSIMTEMRQNALPILENGGVDLVLSGHSHSYERSFLIDGHYGLSSTFNNTMKKDGGSGRVDGTGAYKKPTDGAAPHEGAVYTVAGSSGQTSGGTLNHPAMFISLNVLGSLVLDVNGPKLDAKFLDNTGAIKDYFTIMKGTPVTIPNPPSGLTATAVSTSQINLAWSDNSSNETGFKIERSTDNITFAQITTVGTNVTSYSNTGLAAATKYYYRVSSYNSAGTSAPSAVANATTFSSGGGLAAPSNLQASALSSTNIKLTWTDNTTTETGFKIESSPDNITYTQIATVGANVVTYTHSGRTPNTNYWYRVRAYDATSNSNYSNVATVKTPALPAAPTSLTAVPAAGKKINLSWTDNSSDETGFRIERSTDGVNFSQIASVAANVKTYTNTGLARSTKYYYRVFAYRTTNGFTDNSAYSNIASATTLAH